MFKNILLALLMWYVNNHDNKNFSILKKGNRNWKWKKYGNKLEIKNKLENGNNVKLEVYYM